MSDVLSNPPQFVIDALVDGLIDLAVNTENTCTLMCLILGHLQPLIFDFFQMEN